MVGGRPSVCHRRLPRSRGDALRLCHGRVRGPALCGIPWPVHLLRDGHAVRLGDRVLTAADRPAVGAGALLLRTQRSNVDGAAAALAITWGWRVTVALSGGTALPVRLLLLRLELRVQAALFFDVHVGRHSLIASLRIRSGRQGARRGLRVPRRRAVALPLTRGDRAAPRGRCGGARSNSGRTEAVALRQAAHLYSLAVGTTTIAIASIVILLAAVPRSRRIVEGLGETPVRRLAPGHGGPRVEVALHLLHRRVGEGHGSALNKQKATTTTIFVHTSTLSASVSSFVTCARAYIREITTD